MVNFTRPRRSRSAPTRASSGSGATPSLATLPPGSPRRWRRTRSATSPTRTSTTASGPPGLIRLSTTTGPTPEYLQDFGNTVDAGHHHPPPDALPGAAAARWSSARARSSGPGASTPSTTAPYAAEPADPRMQQAQVNLLADMGAQPTTLMTGLVAATQVDRHGRPDGHDHLARRGRRRSRTAPASPSPARPPTPAAAWPGSRSPPTAAPPGTRPPAPRPGPTPTSRRASAAPPIRVRAIDDSANIGAAATRSVDGHLPVLRLRRRRCPPTPDADDGGAVELGLRFTPDRRRLRHRRPLLQGRRQHRHPHRLALEPPRASGWPRSPSPTRPPPAGRPRSSASRSPVTAGQTYVVSYTAPQGHYAAGAVGLRYRGLDAGAAEVAGGFGAAPAGVYGAPGTFPASSYQNANYFVDVAVHDTDDSPLIGDRASGRCAGSSSVPRSRRRCRRRFSKPMAPGTRRPDADRRQRRRRSPARTSYDARRAPSPSPRARRSPGSSRYTATLAGHATRRGNPVTAGGPGRSRPPSRRPRRGSARARCSTTRPRPTSWRIRRRRAADPRGRGSPPTSTGTVTGVRFYKGAEQHRHPHRHPVDRERRRAGDRDLHRRVAPAGWQTADLRHAGRDHARTPTTSCPTAPRRVATPPPPTPSPRRDLSRAPLRVTSTAGAYTYGTGFPGGRPAPATWSTWSSTRRRRRIVDDLRSRRRRARSTCPRTSKVVRRPLRPGRSPAGR